MVPVPKVL